MDINLYLQILGTSLVRQKNGSSIKGLGKNHRSLFAVPFVRSHPTVNPWTPRNNCVYTRQPQRHRATSGVLTSLPAKLAKIGMRVKTLSDRRHKHFVRVYTASDANWLSRSIRVTLDRTLRHAYMYAYATSRRLMVLFLLPTDW